MQSVRWRIALWRSSDYSPPFSWSLLSELNDPIEKCGHLRQRSDSPVIRWIFIEQWRCQVFMVNVIRIHSNYLAQRVAHVNIQSVQDLPKLGPVSSWNPSYNNAVADIIRPQ